MEYVNSLADETSIKQVATESWDKLVNFGSDFLSTQGSNVINGTTQQPTSSVTESPTYNGTQQIQNPQPNSLVSSVKSVNPLLLGGIAAGIIWFATKRPLFAGLAGAGTWFFTDKMNKGA
jgi:hypothetical protein